MNARIYYFMKFSIPSNNYFPMNYQHHSKNRKLRYGLLRIFGNLSLNFLHLSVPFRFVLLGLILIFASSFLPWFSVGTASFNAYSFLLWGIGYMFIVLMLFLGGLMFWSGMREYLRNTLSLQISDHMAITCAGVMFFLLTLADLFVMEGLIFFSKDLVFFQAPIVTIVGAVLVIWGGILSYRESKRELLSTLYIENNQTSDALFSEYEAILSKKPSEKKNMSLPI